MTRTRNMLITALGAVAVTTLLSAGTASANTVTPKHGSYAGVGKTELRVGLRANSGKVDRIAYKVQLGGCGVSGNLPPAPFDASGRFKAHTASGGSRTTLRGRFVSPTRVRGHFTSIDSDPSCTDAHRVRFELRRFGKVEEKPGSAQVRDGRYAGAGKNAYVWFKVESGEVLPGTAGLAFFPNCAERGFYFPDASAIGAGGDFSAYGGYPDNTYALGGTFITSQKVVGTMYWNTTDDCPAGQTKFTYSARRVAAL